MQIVGRFGGVGLSNCFLDFAERFGRPVFPLQDRIVPEGVLEAGETLVVSVLWGDSCPGKMRADRGSILVASAYRSVFSILQSGLVRPSRFQEAIVPERVFEAWREPCSIRCCGEIAAEVGSCNRGSILVASAYRSVFSILQRGLVTGLPDTGAHRS